MDKVKISVDCGGLDLLQKVMGVFDENMNVLAGELGIAFGAVSKPKWKSVRRSARYDESFLKTMERATGEPFDADAKAIAAAYLSDDPPKARLPLRNST